jgi:hypothetical protein
VLRHDLDLLVRAPLVELPDEAVGAEHLEAGELAAHELAQALEDPQEVVLEHGLLVPRRAALSVTTQLRCFAAAAILKWEALRGASGRKESVPQSVAVRVIR